MVPVKSPKEYYVQQEVIVLFCETVERYIYSDKHSYKSTIYVAAVLSEIT